MSLEVFQLFSCYPQDNVILSCMLSDNDSLFICKPEGVSKPGIVVLYSAKKVEDIYKKIGWYSSDNPSFTSVDHMDFSQFLVHYPQAIKLREKNIKVSYQVIPSFYKNISIGKKYYPSYLKKDLKVGRSVTFFGDVEGTIEVQ